MLMAKKTVNIDEKAHKNAKILSAKTGISIGEIIELLVNGADEKEILELAEKRNGRKGK